jgi:hypothetical protein
MLLADAATNIREICGKRGSSGVLEPLDPEVLDDRVRKQLAAHILDIGIASAVGKIELDELTGTNVVDARKAEPFESVVDGLALRVEDAGLQGNEDARFHLFACRLDGAEALWRGALGRASFGADKRRAGKPLNAPAARNDRRV